MYEDGKPQKILYFLAEDIPVTVGLVIDQSRSMQPKYSQVAAAALVFIRSGNPQDEVFLVLFNERVRFGLPPGTDFSSDPAALLEALNSSRPDGKTALNDAIDTAVQHVKKGSRDKQVLIVISDGGDNASKMKADEVIAEVQRSDAVVYAIGLADEYDPDRNPRFLKKIAEVSGGEAYFPDRLEELVAICRTIARDVRSQYTIGYTPTNTSLNGAYRRIKILVRSPKKRLVARTRSGYYAPSASSPEQSEAITKDGPP